MEGGGLSFSVGAFMFIRLKRERRYRNEDKELGERLGRKVWS